MARILWIEDEFNSVEPLRILLIENGIEVTRARSKKEALGKLLSMKFNLIIVDLILPQGPLEENFEPFVGVSIAKYIKEKNIQVPLVIYSIVREPKIETELNQLGFELYYKGNTDVVEFSKKLIEMAKTSD